MKTTARVKRVVISPDVLFHVFGTNTAWRVEQGIPVGSRLRGLTLDPYSNTLNLFVEHESFDEVSNETVVSQLDMLFKKL